MKIIVSIVLMALLACGEGVISQATLPDNEIGTKILDRIKSYTGDYYGWLSSYRIWFVDLGNGSPEPTFESSETFSTVISIILDEESQQLYAPYEGCSNAPLTIVSPTDLAMDNVSPCIGTNSEATIAFAYSRAGTVTYSNDKLVLWYQIYGTMRITDLSSGQLLEMFDYLVTFKGDKS